MLQTERLALLTQIEALARERGTVLFLVGGAVRDLLLNRAPWDQDLDLVVEGSAEDFGAALTARSGGQVKAFPDFLTAKVVKPTAFPSLAEIDFASARQEIYPRPGALPCVSPARIEDDLRRRDFSINAMALRLGDFNRWAAAGQGLGVIASQVLDYFDGRRDLEHGLVRVLHARSFMDDPTRVFRACRYAVRIAGALESVTEGLLRDALRQGALDTISVFRRLTELRKICAEASPDKIMALLARCGVFREWRLLEAQHEQEALAALSDAASLAAARAPGAYYQIMLRIFCRFSDAARRAGRLAAMGLGKKEIRRVLDDVEQSMSGGVVHGLSDEALALAMACSGAEQRRAELQAESQRRSELKARQGPRC
jgi:tRNA nucleotidyltransferase/poly(A) polymerase